MPPTASDTNAEVARRLAVLGSPIAHSKSPALHRAAYGVLGLDWNYEAIDVTTASLAEFIATRGPEWRGLSLTMPLKNAIVPHADSADGITRLTGAANTVLFEGETGHRTLRVFNTDVWGIQQAFQRSGIPALHDVVILGGGATAASAVVASTRLGASHVVIAVRSPEKATPILELAGRCGAAARVLALSDVAELTSASAVISTLPGGTRLEVPPRTALAQTSVLFDVAYDPWPSALARQWSAVGGRVIPGIDMLIYQALVQIRIFTAGEPERPLDREELVVAAMRAAVDP